MMRRPWWTRPGVVAAIGALVVVVAIGSSCGSDDDAERAVDEEPAAITTPSDTDATEPPAAAPPDAIMPAVVCKNLQEAQDLIQQYGVFFSRSVDATGQGRRQIFDRNWLVVAQTPDPGTPIGEGDPVLSVVRYGEPAPC